MNDLIKVLPGVANLARNSELSKTARALRKFGVGDAYQDENEEIWIFRERLPGGFFLFQKPSGEVLRVDRYDTNSSYVNEDWVGRKISESKFRRVNLNKRGEPDGQGDIGKEDATKADLKAPYRKALMEAIDGCGLRPTRLLIQQAIYAMPFLFPAESLSFGPKPSLKTVRTWLRERGERGRRTWSASASLQGRVPRRSRLGAQPLEILTFQIAPKFWADELMAMGTAFALLVDEVKFYNAAGAAADENFVPIVAPSRSTMWRHILSYASFETFEAKYGRKRAERQFNGTGPGRSAEGILQVAMMDHTVLDLIAVDGRTGCIIGRPIITVLIDVYSRCVIGYYVGFNPAGLSTVLACLKNTFRQKFDCRGAEQFPILQDIYGCPDRIIVDNGLEFVSRSIMDVSADIGITLEACPVKAPTWKAIVERFFGVLNQLGIHSFPGTTLNKQKKLLSEYDSSKSACFTLEQIKDLIDRVLYMYHIEGHRGLNNTPPALLWQRDAVRNYIPNFKNIEALDMILGVSGERTVQRDGVEIHGLQYHTKAKTEIFLGDYPKRAGMQFKIKYDPEDISRIHVYHPGRREYIELKCTDVNYSDGLSLFAHERIREYVKREGLEFSSVAQRCSAKAELYHTLNKYRPKQRQVNAKKEERLRSSAGFQRVAAQKGAALPAVVPLIPQDLFVPDREDGGKLAKVPPRGRAKSEDTRNRNLKRKAEDKKRLEQAPGRNTAPRVCIDESKIYEGY